MTSNKQGMEKAIKKAEEGGFQGFDSGDNEQDFYNSCILNHLFWKALSKQQGWNGRYNWIHYAHKGFRHIMTGKDIDSFFNELLHD